MPSSVTGAFLSRGGQVHARNKLCAMPTPPIRVRAPGKINIFLQVGAVQDDGYHDLATAFQALSLWEEVDAAPAATITVEVEGPGDLSSVPRDDRNLAVRAARLLAATTGYDGGVALTIRKTVPVAGGMGGGSADAAATLVACDALWQTGLSSADLTRLAARLGADVPFALRGGTAIGTGRGDRLSPALTGGGFDWVLATSDDGLSTPAVYRALDEHRDEHAPDIGRAPDAPVVDPEVLYALRAGDPARLAEALRNDLQAPALRLRPALGETIALGERHGALAGIVSGSGPTIAFLAGDPHHARSLADALAREGHRAIPAHGPVHGARIV